ncbi:hypothetical protein JAO74_17170 [Sphingomonas sp. BT553]|uniref:Uncharacterized protein n=1 Tax=Sphingomonas mollis TaxID=2795726 RepID=A0ABS0XU18_9SPHN|nr:hypothetical protein [Sphingomonas sp. BT553]
MLRAIGGVTLPLLLGAIVGVTDFVGWALLPRPARGAGSYARYTMVGKLARGWR